jgi:predicted GIY-YIG superfamily endonuclease
MAKRDTYRYRLKDGNKVVYIGITNDPERRAREHKEVVERSWTFEVVGPRVTEESARKWEDERLKAYRASHGGRNPRYNKGRSG